MTARALPIVAIDGPAGAGKSTVAKLLANELGFLLVDTGAIYRAVALSAERHKLGWHDAEKVGLLAETLVKDQAITFRRAADGGVEVFLHGEDISKAIRSKEIGMGASLVSAHAKVRDALLSVQRQAGKAGGVVLEGRDIGTVVFPDADVKFFLTASVEVRARRRFDELHARGEAVTYEETLRDVQKRDAQDTERAHAPLKQASDAKLIDSTALGLAETVQAMAAIVRAAPVTSS